MYCLGSSRLLESATDVEKQREQEKNEWLRQKGIEHEKQQKLEQQMREEQLTKSTEEIFELNQYNEVLAKAERAKLEWELYTACGKLPNPSLCDQINTYLHIWSSEIENTTVPVASKRTSDVIKLLNDLEDLIDDSTYESAQTIENWLWIYKMIKEYQSRSLDVATYKLLKCSEKIWTELIYRAPHITTMMIISI